MEPDMKTVLRQVSRIEINARAIADDDRRLAQILQDQRQRRAEMAAAKEKLLVDLGDSLGLLDLPASAIVRIVTSLKEACARESVAAPVEMPTATAEKPARATRTAGSAPPPRGRGGSRDATDDGDGRVFVTVKVSRNVGAERRGLLESAGLRWHGKSGTWQGRVTAEVVARLQDAFGDRVAVHSPPAPAVAAADSGSRAAGPDAAIVTGDEPMPARAGTAGVAGPAAPPPVDPAAAPAVGAAADGPGVVQDAAADASAPPAPVQDQPIMPVADVASNPPRPAAASPFAGFRRSTARR
jgi:hypothetical protein